MNKITCICLGVKNMEKAIKFYRDGLGYKTNCKENNPPVCFFDTPGTKFELYPLDLLVKDIDESSLKIGSGFSGFTLAYNVEKKEDVDKLLTDKENCYSRAYDLVLNGYELLSGSVRIHNKELQAKVFEAIGMTIEYANDKFGFFMEAFNYGAPPHAGVGIGIERLLMILQNTDNIRDVVAFPKTLKATDLMSLSPSGVYDKQLIELGIEVKEK